MSKPVRELLLVLCVWIGGLSGLVSAQEAFPVREEPLPSRPPLDAAARMIHNTLAQPDFPVLATAVAPDGRHMATGGHRVVHLWDRQQGRLQQSWQASDSWIRTLAFSPDGRVLAAAGDAGVVHLLDRASQSPLPPLPGAGGTIYGIAFSPDGTVLASGAADHSIQLWDMAGGRSLKHWQAHGAAVLGLAFSPDGASLISGAQDGSVNRWNMQEAVPTARAFKGNRNSVHAVAYSPDGQWIAAGEYRTIHIWNAHTGQAQPLSKKHASWVRSLAFNADSTLLASASDEGVLRLWKIFDGVIQEQWAGHQAAAFSVSFLHNQDWLSSGGDGRILIWQQGFATPLWSFLGYPDGGWIACPMLGKRQCHQPDDGHLESAERAPTRTDSPPPPVAHGLPWHEWGTILVICVALLAVAWQRVALPPLRGRWSVLLTLLRGPWGNISPPSPQHFARRVGGRVDWTVPNNRHMARIDMQEEWPVPLAVLYYCRLQPGQRVEKIPVWLNSAMHPMGEAVVDGADIPRSLLMLVGADSAQRELLQPLLHGLDGLWVMLDAGEMTRLLLAVQPRQALLHLLADYLDPVALSPYRNTGPVDKAPLFFGRQELLGRLVQEGRRNHLLVGGQGMGKSSLLRALARKYQHHPVIRVALFSPEQGDIAIPLARFLSLASDSLEELLEELARFPERKKPVLLIDDADAFVATDATRGFATLERLAHLSTQGCCHTILTGSWGIQRLLHGIPSSPLWDWVEVHRLGPLETEASWHMVRNPMAWIRREWEANVCMELIQASGGRPDWTAVLCHGILEQLAVPDKTIAQHHVDAAMISQGVGEYLDRWPTLLSDGEEERRQDRLLVYSSVGMDGFSHADLMVLLQKKYPVFFSMRGKKAEVGPPDVQLQRALDRLQLACILLKTGDHYRFASSLLRMRVLQQHPEERLKRVLRMA
ncbi:MAG: AAA family ATPase [Magnetococcales bacterium]|nr:AAA family ATPase [Magnetococcales bacterium]